MWTATIALSALTMVRTCSICSLVRFAMTMLVMGTVGTDAEAIAL